MKNKLKLLVDHPWDVSPREARDIQAGLAPMVIREGPLSVVNTVAGIDVGFEGGESRAAVVVLKFPDLTLSEYATAKIPTTFPYVPGLLSFREIPAVLEALKLLRSLPDLLLCDGQGEAHPRRFGLASHLGVITGIPAIGVAKSRLIGTHDPLPDKKGEWVHLKDKNQVIGAVLRSRTGVKPLYISIGHKITLKGAIRFVLRCTPKYRLPETTRLAHMLASKPEQFRDKKNSCLQDLPGCTIMDKGGA